MGDSDEDKIQAISESLVREVRAFRKAREEHKAAPVGVVFECSFCGRPSREAQKLISGPGVFVCDVCVARCLAATYRVAESSSERAALFVGGASPVGQMLCNFCREAKNLSIGIVLTVASDRGGAVDSVGLCVSCLEVCLDILADDLGGQWVHERLRWQDSHPSPPREEIPDQG